ncbi:MAG: hypothetical protein K8T26_08460 [Lentisphaerae bacterium]|nr:hypothetical protein [Lentisphaerota bacterium]
MKGQWPLIVLLAVCAAGAWGEEADDTRVEVQPGASAASEARIQTRSHSETGRQLRQTAMQARQAYQEALGRQAGIAQLDRDLAADQAELERLTGERKRVAERESSQCALERDAWIDARDHLQALRNDGQSPAAEIEQARQQADAAQRAFRQAMVSIPAVQDLDAKLTALRARLSQRYIERRAAEATLAETLATERAAMAASEKAYLEYVYGP